MKKEDLDLFIETSDFKFNNAKEISEFRERILFDYILKIEEMIEGLKEFQDRDEAFLSQANELNAKLNNDLKQFYKIKDLEEQKTCKTCAKKLLCEMAQKSKDTFGTKLSEQWFNCYIEEES